jgi:histone acetyltransferase (RNA polymerase elongator complex component)
MLNFGNLLEEVYLKNNCVYCGGTPKECTPNNYCDDRKSNTKQIDDATELEAEVNQSLVIMPFRKRKLNE